ncbi:MAG: alanine racemase [Clostridia bacterium]|nr:alanine racemase [Clostridia bacterium]
MEKFWQAKLEISKENIIYNINKIKEFIGPKVDVMPIIKDNGYKTNLNDRIDILKACMVKIVGVAILDEAISMRNLGFKEEIFILNQIYKEDIEHVAKYNITVGVGATSFLKELGKNSKYNFKIHIEIDTGMGRTGIKANQIEEFIQEAKKYPNIQIEGIYTHFSCSDDDCDFTKIQILKFNEAYEKAKNLGIEFKYVHCCNSAGIFNFSEAHFNLVRPGIILYGYYPAEDIKQKVEVRPAIKLKSKISFLKDVDKGTTISYGKRYITDKKSKIATVQLGYADGIRRSLSNKGYVVVNGKRAPIVGTVCMDCFMVDVTDIPDVDVQDEVYLWDNEIVTVEDIANIYDTINYEVISTISERVVREYI